MIQAVLIDDEHLAVETLALQLQKYCPTVQIIAKLTDSVEAFSFLKSHLVDLVFLDIEMPYLNGFDLLNKLSPIPFDVIFTTAYDQFAIRAFKYSAFDYLLKPIDEHELSATVAKYVRLKDRTIVNRQLDQLLHYKAHPELIDKIALPTFEGLEFVEIKHIIRCKAASNYTELYFTDAPMMLVCRTLKEIEELLGHVVFLRVHHSHLVNKNHVRKFIKTDGGMIRLSDGSEVPISRGRKEEIIGQITTKIA